MHACVCVWVRHAGACACVTRCHVCVLVCVYDMGSRVRVAEAHPSLEDMALDHGATALWTCGTDARVRVILGETCHVRVSSFQKTLILFSGF